MNSKVKKGCGIGCALAVLACAALVGSGMWFARQMGQDFAVVEQTERALVAAHGAPGTWAPEDLVPSPDRVAAFVQVRRGTAEWRGNLERTVAQWLKLDQDAGNPLTRAVRGLRAVGQSAPVYGGFWAARNKALLEAGMGPDEYAWMYHLVYHGWLGYDPGAGLEDSDMDPATLGAVLGGRGLSEGRSVVDGVAGRGRRNLIMPLLEAATAGSAEQERWRSEELARLAADPGRWPWRTDLPPEIAAAFAPHESELAAGWSPATNPMELLLEMSGGGTGGD